MKLKEKNFLTFYSRNYLLTSLFVAIARSFITLGFKYSFMLNFVSLNNLLTDCRKDRKIVWTYRQTVKHKYRWKDNHTNGQKINLKTEKQKDTYKDRHILSI